MEGVSLRAAFDGETSRGEKPLYWDFSGNHAIRVGDWKLVAERSKDWELYDLSKDRSETQDLAANKPGRVRKLAAKYDAWAKRVGARKHSVAQKAKAIQAVPTVRPRCPAQAAAGNAITADTIYVTQLLGRFRLQL